MCRGCWWNEGGRCYVGNPPRDENGRSKVEAKERCDKFQSKRQVLSDRYSQRQTRNHK